MDIIINLNKPKGITSYEATSEVKRILKAKKAGHTGTLDPLATGILLICINRATRLASYFSSLDKEYRAVMKLGEVTDTQDSSGTVVRRAEGLKIKSITIENAMKSFEGNIFQKPPMFSALKYKGKALYKYARKGQDIHREHREVHIYNIEPLGIDLPFVTFRVVCSKGTYIRTLCNDIGEKLGVGAHLSELERTGVGPFRISDSLKIEELVNSVREKTPLELYRGVYTMGAALSWMPELKIAGLQVKSVKNGMPIKINQGLDLSDDLKASKGIRIKSPDGELLAIGSFLHSKNIIRMDVVL